MARGRTLEANIEAKACRLIERELGIVNIKLNLRGNNGWPDRVFWVPGGRPLLIEFKRVGEEPEPLQKYVHDHLRKLGYDIEVHDSVDGAFTAVARALEASRLPKEGGEVSARARVRRAPS